jgi:hypothetical protein
MIHSPPPARASNLRYDLMLSLFKTDQPARNRQDRQLCKLGSEQEARPEETETSLPSPKGMATVTHPDGPVVRLRRQRFEAGQAPNIERE